MKRLLESLKFNEKGLIPAIIQDRATKEVLTLCYLNEEALKRTIEEGFVYVFRRSKNMLMKKGGTSGCVQEVKSVCLDCEGNSLLIVVDQVRAGCHTGYFTCYYRIYAKDGSIQTVGKPLFDPDEVYKKK